MGKEFKESSNKELEESPEVKESEEIEGTEGTEGTNRIEKVEREVDNLKSDVQKISEDLKSVVADLKESIVDVRSAVSEIENPFNLLRVISSEEDLKKLNSQRGARAMPPGAKSMILGKPEKKEVAKPAKPTEEVPPFEVEEREEEEERIFRLPLPKTGLGYLDWVWSLLESGLNPQDIADLARCYELLGYLPASSSNWIFSLAHAAQKARSRKLDKDYLLLTMYKAATISGIEIGLEDARELVCIAERKKNRVRKGKTDRVRKGKTDRVRKRA